LSKSIQKRNLSQLMGYDQQNKARVKRIIRYT
jgi:hypothetical protein